MVQNHGSSSLHHFLHLKDHELLCMHHRSDRVKMQKQLHIIVVSTTPRHCPPASSNNDSFFVYQGSHLNITFRSETNLAVVLFSRVDKYYRVFHFDSFLWNAAGMFYAVVSLDLRIMIQMQLSFFYFNYVKWVILPLPSNKNCVRKQVD